MSIIETVGKTPLVHLDELSKDLGAKLYLKLEARNPSASVKDRAALWMVQEALERGLIKDGVSIIEPTSGNMGIGLAAVGASLGIPVVLTMPETMSVERRKLIESYGAELVLTPGKLGMKGAIEEARKRLEQEPQKYYMPMQFSNAANALAHEESTGPEIFEVLGKKIDVFLAGVGTGGTITGVSRFFKKNKGIKIISIAVEPAESPVIGQRMQGAELKPAPHGIQGIGAGFIPDILDLSLIDRVIQVTTQEAMEYARLLTKKEGISSGISGGANLCAMSKLCQEAEMKGKTIVSVIPDDGAKYLSTPLFS